MSVPKSEFQLFYNFPFSTLPIFHTHCTSNYLLNIIKIKLKIGIQRIEIIFIFVV